MWGRTFWDKFSSYLKEHYTHRNKKGLLKYKRIGGSKFARLDKQRAKKESVMSNTVKQQIPKTNRTET